LGGQKRALDQPAGFVGFLGEFGAIPVERRRQLLQAAVGQRPGDLGPLMTLGNTYVINQKVADEGRWWFQAAIAAAPANAAAHRGLGVALYDRGEVDAAIASYQRAIALDRKDARAHSNLGLALERKGQVDKAIASYEKAIELEPKFALAHNNLGLALERKGKVDEAIAFLQKAIALDPKLAQAHSNLGAILCDVKQDYDGA